MLFFVIWHHKILLGIIAKCQFYKINPKKHNIILY